MRGPLFGALHALAVDDSGGRACLAFTLLAARGVKRVVDAVERAVIAPQDNYRNMICL